MAGRWEEEEREGSCIYLRVISGTLLWKYWWSSAPGRLECSEHRATPRGLETARDGDCELSSRVIQFFHQYLNITVNWRLNASLSTRHWHWDIFKCMFITVSSEYFVYRCYNWRTLRANITVVSSSDILLQLYCKILDPFRVPVSWKMII